MNTLTHDGIEYKVTSLPYLVTDSEGNECENILATDMGYDEAVVGKYITRDYVYLVVDVESEEYGKSYAYFGTGANYYDSNMKLLLSSTIPELTPQAFTERHLDGVSNCGMLEL